MANEVAPGATASFPKDGTNAPTSPRTWEVRKAGSVIAHSASAAGWTVSRVSNTITVSAPVGATPGTDYEVRHTGLELGGG